MTDPNNNTPKFRLPDYINIPLFLYHDKRLEKPATLMAAFFYSLVTSGKSIRASKDYLCELVGIGKSHYFNTLNHLEDCGYIKRTGNTTRRKILWVYQPNSSIIIDESDSVYEENRPAQKSHTSPLQRTQLVHSSGLSLSTPVDTDIKEDTREDNKTLLSSVRPRTKKIKSSDYEKDERFMRFYKAYPLRKKGAHAYKMWLRINPDEALFTMILEDIEKRKAEDTQWIDGFVPHPGTYLNPECPGWKDEIVNRDKVKAENKKLKQALAEEENKARLEKQEEASQQRAKQDRINDHLKQSDAVTYKKTLKSIPSEQQLAGIKGLKSILGR